VDFANRYFAISIFRQLLCKPLERKENIIEEEKTDRTVSGKS
jgi:hypothetical protein